MQCPSCTSPNVLFFDVPHIDPIVGLETIVAHCTHGHTFSQSRRIQYEAFNLLQRLIPGNKCAVCFGDIPHGRKVHNALTCCKEHGEILEDWGNHMRRRKK